MGTNALIDIAIGLILMYLVLSLICTSINEFIATLFKMRAATLRMSLETILDDETVRGIFDEHGLVVGSKANVKTNPSYLSGSIFAMALMDSVVSPKKPMREFSQVENAARSLRPGNLRDLLTTNLATANQDLDQLRTGLATSFDQFMDRASGAYKRKLKWISLIVGLLLAAGLNADSIAVGKALWMDGSLRTQMAQVAQAAVTSTAVSEQAQAAARTADPGQQRIDTIVTQIKQAERQLRPLPIGWEKMPDWTWQFFVPKVGGLLMTAIAVMLGAPFWFDVLSKFMKIRSTGDKPAQTIA
jgi:outer membrane murein-binding lipoprotein Lpp